MIVEVVGSTGGLERSFSRASRSATHFDRSLSRSFRGAAAGSGVFRSLGRSLAFASGGFLAFASAADLVRGSLQQATERAATEKQLAAQFRASGVSLDVYRKRIDDATNSLSKLAGIEDDELKRAFTTAFRGSQNVSAALKIQAVAADVARGRHIDLSTAAIALTKAYGGQATALKRLGIQVPSTLKGMAAIEFVARRFAGQARAGTTAQERFVAVFRNTEEVVGGALLPTFTKYVNQLSRWLTDTRNQERLQAAVANGLQRTIRFTRGLIDVVRPLVGTANNVAHALGGWKIALEFLVTAKVLGGLASLVRAFAAVRTAALLAAGAELAVVNPLLAIGVATTAMAVVAIANWDSILAGVQRYSRGLDGVLRKTTETQDQMFVNMIRRAKQAGSLGPGGLIGQGGISGVGLGGGTAQRGGTSPRFGFGRTSDERAQDAADAALRAAGLASDRKRNGLQEQFRRTRLALAKAEVTAGDADNRVVLVEQARILRAAIALTSNLKKRTALYQELAGVQDQIRSIDKTVADKQAAHQKALADSAQKQLSRLKTTEAKLKTKIAGIQASFQSAVDAARQGIGDLFAGPVKAAEDEVRKRTLGVRTPVGPTAASVIGGLKAQTAQAAAFQRDINSLLRQEKGNLTKAQIKQLRTQLEAQGISSAPEVRAILGGGPGAIKGFARQFQAREKLAFNVAKTVMRAQLVTLRADKLQLANVREKEQHIHVHLGEKEVAHVVTKQQTRDGKRTVVQRSGRNAGLGLIGH